MNAPIATLLEEPQLSLKPSTDDICISEIFGPTIQGEGALIGAPTVFIRTGGCDYRCHWCDTGYAVLPEFEKDWKLIDSQSVLEQVETLSQQKPLWVTLSGGNPAMQNFEALIRMGQAKGYQFSMETQGSIAKPWFSLLDQITFSPKPPSSGMHFKQRGLKRCLDACGELENVSFKFVIANKEDLHWAKDIADNYPNIPSFLQSCNQYASIDTLDSAENSSTEQQQRLLSLIDSAQKIHWYNVRILPQLQSWLWGDKKGV